MTTKLYQFLFPGVIQIVTVVDIQHLNSYAVQQDVTIMSALIQILELQLHILSTIFVSSFKTIHYLLCLAV